MIEVPDGSIYFWMYEQGLRGVDPLDVGLALRSAGKEVRGKDWINFFNGYNKHQPLSHQDPLSFGAIRSSSNSTLYFTRKFTDYPALSKASGLDCRWVPADKQGRPLMSWKHKGLSIKDASCYQGVHYLSENNKGCPRIIIDVDGDHGGSIDHETLAFMEKYRTRTRALTRPGEEVVSYHLDFSCNRAIPTMHFPRAHIDILGNTSNTLRCWKNKQSNRRSRMIMTEDIWNDIRDYIRSRERN